MKALKIVYLGTAEFGVPVLDALHHSIHQVVGVVTAPDKPAGRGLKLHSSPIKEYAVANDLILFQPEKLKDPLFLDTIRLLHADVFVVVAFRMMPAVLWAMPPLGTINLHASLLPQYRGAAPIHWAVINGERETGLTTFKLVHEIDMGSMIYQTKISIGNHETTGEVYARLMTAGPALMLHTLDDLASGNAPLTPQTSSPDLHHAPKLHHDTGHIDWTQGIDKCFNLIRGLCPYPTAWTTLDSKTLKIFQVEKIAKARSNEIGSYSTDGKTYLHYHCPDGSIALMDIQMEGKKRMKVDEFLRGYTPLNSMK